MLGSMSLNPVARMTFLLTYCCPFASVVVKYVLLLVVDGMMETTVPFVMVTEV